MSPLKRDAILLRLMRRMHDHGSWCGETHVQKAMELFQDLAGADTGFEFVLYRHGPFSFELRDELTSLRADELLDLRVQPQPYGPKLIPTERAESLEGKFPNTLQKYSDRIDFIANVVGDKGVGELERVATAMFLTRREMIGTSPDDRAVRLCKIKPHISKVEADVAVKEVDGLIKQARRKKFIH